MLAIKHFPQIFNKHLTPQKRGNETPWRWIKIYYTADGAPRRLGYYRWRERRYRCTVPKNDAKWESSVTVTIRNEPQTERGWIGRGALSWHRKIPTVARPHQPQHFSTRRRHLRSWGWLLICGLDWRKPGRAVQVTLMTAEFAAEYLFKCLGRLKFNYILIHSITGFIKSYLLSIL